MKLKNMENNLKRNRITYVALSVVTVACGLLSRSSYLPMSDFISTYAGDVLWAMLVFWLFCIIAPGGKTWQLCISAIMFSFVIEFSQFYHAPWIDSLRCTTLGGLILGFGFKSSDFACYLIGVFLGVAVRLIMNKGDSRVKS